MSLEGQYPVPRLHLCSTYRTSLPVTITLIISCAPETPAVSENGLVLGGMETHVTK